MKKYVASPATAKILRSSFLLIILWVQAVVSFKTALAVAVGVPTPVVTRAVVAPGKEGLNCRRKRQGHLPAVP
jgi:hypothetical protein